MPESAMPEFFIVDVFANSRFAGNQLAVFTDGGALSDAQMQAIAAEMHFSETSFILGRSDPAKDDPDATPSFAVRIFTPLAEVPFAGHPTLGTAFVLQQLALRRAVPTIHLDMPAGRIPVAFTYRDGHPDVLTMRQIPPAFGASVPPGQAARALSLPDQALHDTLVPQIVSTGLPFLIVPLKGIEEVRAARLDLAGFAPLAALHPGLNVLLFCAETVEAENDLHVRVFVPEYGVSEDPATGSANGCLCAYLLRNRVYGDRLSLRAEQGYEVNRPSLLFLQGEFQNQGEFQSQGEFHGGSRDGLHGDLRSDRENRAYRIEIGGRVHWMARGTLYTGPDL